MNRGLSDTRIKVTVGRVDNGRVTRICQIGPPDPKKVERKTATTSFHF